MNPSATSSPAPVRDLPSLLDDDDEVTSPEIEVDLDDPPPSTDVAPPWAPAQSAPPDASAAKLASPWRSWLVVVSLGGLVAVGFGIEEVERARSIGLFSVVDQDEVARRVELASERVDEGALEMVTVPLERSTAASASGALRGTAPTPVVIPARPQETVSSEPPSRGDEVVATAEATDGFDPLASTRGAFATHTPHPSRRRLLVPDLDERSPDGAIDYTWRPSGPPRVATTAALPPPTRLSPDGGARHGRLQASPAGP